METFFFSEIHKTLSDGWNFQTLYNISHIVHTLHVKINSQSNKYEFIYQIIQFAPIISYFQYSNLSLDGIHFQVWIFTTSPNVVSSHPAGVCGISISINNKWFVNLPYPLLTEGKCSRYFFFLWFCLSSLYSSPDRGRLSGGSLPW